MVLNTLARKKLPYDPVKDFTPISMLFTAPMYLFVNPSIKANDVHELIALAKAKPGVLTFASIGAGSSSHLAGELLKSRAGIDMLHVPYRGGPEATTALIAGQVDIMFNGGNALPQLERGRVRAIGMGSLKRATTMPNLPTLDEAGLTGFDVSPWFAMFAPTGTPRPLIDLLNKDLVMLLKEQSIRDKAAMLSLEIESSTPDQMAARMKSDFPVWEKVMRQAGIQAE
jgi:tripartite-type tricarboxylate transporter receptor subunit TctC